MPEWLHIILLTLGAFLLLLMITPIFGRKPVSGMTALDYIIGFVLAVVIALTIVKVIPVTHGLLSIFFWLGAIIGMQYLIQKSKWMHDRLYGKEIVVVKEGKILEENLQSARMTGEELMSQLRRKNVFAIADVEFAVMEANGDIHTLLKKERQPLTPIDLNLPVNQEKEPQTVILDGNILDEPLTARGLNRAWLSTELDKIGIIEDQIFLAQVNSMGELYIDLFDDAIQLPQPTTKDLLLASLKKAEADFINYALETNDSVWKNTYEQHAQTINQLITQLEPYIAGSYFKVK